MQKQEVEGKLVNQSEAKDGPNVAPFVDSQSAEGRQTMRVDLIPIFTNSLIHFNFFVITCRSCWKWHQTTSGYGAQKKAYTANYRRRNGFSKPNSEPFQNDP